MSETSLEQFGLDRPESGDDVAVPFTLENLDSRGRVVTLGPALDTIISRHGYPEPVARLLGEAIVLAGLIGSSLRQKGRGQNEIVTCRAAVWPISSGGESLR